MSREIKFRAWDEIGKWMGNVTSFDFDEGAVFIETKHSDDENRFDMNNVPVMQYTGLKDKNGKEIFEGDILNWAPVETNQFNLYEGQNDDIQTAVFEDGCFMAKDKDGFVDFIDAEKVEIIGNIYEHSHLLEVQHD